MIALRVANPQQHELCSLSLVPDFLSFYSEYPYGCRSLTKHVWEHFGLKIAWSGHNYYSLQLRRGNKFVGGIKGTTRDHLARKPETWISTPAGKYQG